MTCIYLGVVTNVCGGEGLSRKVGDPVTEIVVTCCDDAPLLEVEGVADVKCRAKSISMFQ